MSFELVDVNIISFLLGLSWVICFEYNIKFPERSSLLDRFFVRACVRACACVFECVFQTISCVCANVFLIETFPCVSHQAS